MDEAKLSSTTSTSKVTVECTDPSNLFESIQPLLAERLPLRDLNWKAPNRPLRSIDSLHIDLVRTKNKAAGDGDGDSQKQRRHQIPGLRKTPYVKIYLLRCDDNEIYKSAARKAVREWVKILSPSSSSNGNLGSQEGHDACEWLILHVVLPGTAVASQPRTSKRSSDGPSDSTESIPGKSKWPGRGSSTVFEKLKADFNTSSRSGLDHVAQVRVGKDEPNPMGLSKAELESAWQDLTDKLKVALLTSFDKRVRQYEDDIHERDSQRALPGWNFCTFFILKEGLAEGFEDVGLYEDALVGYDELSLGLDLIIREQATGLGDAHGGTLLLSTDDLAEKAKAFLDQGDDPKSKDDGKKRRSNKSLSLELKSEDLVLDPKSKPYRDLILANRISIFDFRVYIFSRQLSLLLKAARPSRSSSTPESDADFVLLSEICHRATEFIGVGSRTLREDLRHAFTTVEEKPLLKGKAEQVIANMVSSWIYRLSLQILMETSSSALIVPETGKLETEPPQDHGELRPTSMARSRSSDTHNIPLTFSNGDMPKATASSKRLSTQPNPRNPVQSLRQKTGTEELASARAELYLVARRVLEEMGRTRSWPADWNDLGLITPDVLYDAADMEEVSLDDASETEAPKRNGTFHAPVAAGLQPLQLNIAASHKDRFYDLFESLTNQAHRHFVAGNKTKSAESAITDLALIKYRAGEYNAAASLFRRLSVFYESGSWPILSGTLLELYAKCLEPTAHVKEYLIILVRLLSSYARENKLRKLSLHSNQFSNKYVKDLIDKSQQLSQYMLIPFDSFFSITATPTQISPRSSSDGFSLDLGLRCCLGQALEVHSGITLIMKCTTDLYASPITLRTSSPVLIRDVPTKISLESYVTATGPYVLDEMSFEIANLQFIHTFKGRNEEAATLSPASNVAPVSHSQPIMLFPAAQAVHVKVTALRHIKLGERHQMEVELNSGWNDIERCIIRIKPATAGMRLSIKEAECLDGSDVDEMDISEEEGSQGLLFADIGSHSRLKFAVPYTMENPEVVNMDARIEVLYKAEQGNFTLLTTVSWNTTLPLNVNVQDLFKSTVLFSRFTIGSAMLVPLRLHDCKILGSEQINVDCGMNRPLAMDIFPRQPASLLYKFTPTATATSGGGGKTLKLRAEYTCLDELALQTVEDRFRTDILVSDISPLKGLLLPHLLQVFRSQWTANDLEAIGLLRAIQPWAYTDFGWSSVLASFDRDTQQRATSWLSRWHSGNATIPLNPVDLGSDVNRRIVINVELPTPSAVVTVALTVSESSISSSLTVGVGQAVAAEVTISYTKQWASADERNDRSQYEITYEISPNVDAWLVGGRRRGNFVGNPGEEARFPLMLLPQRAGRLLLPTVDIKCFKTEREGAGEGGEMTGLKKSEVACEVDYRSQAKSLLAIPDLSETTVGLDGDGSARGSWLVGSKKRLEIR